MADYRVEGAEKLRKLARDLRIAGNTDLQKELHKGLTQAVQPMGREIRAEIPKKMPSGYAPTLSKAASVRVSTRTGAESVSVRLVASAKGRKQKRDLQSLDRGKLRHPRFGDRRRWYVTRVSPGFFTEPAERLRDTATNQAIAAIERVAEKLERG